MCLYFWLSCWGFGGFPANFEHFNEHMPKESPRGSGNDQFGYNSEHDKNDEFLDFNATFNSASYTGLQFLDGAGVFCRDLPLWSCSAKL